MYSIDETIVSAKDCWPTPAKHCCYNTPNCVRAPHHEKKETTTTQRHGDINHFVVSFNHIAAQGAFQSWCTRTTPLKTRTVEK